MGVRGLKTFIEKNEDLFERDHRLHDTEIVVDAANLVAALYTRSQKHERRDLFGGDMVQFGNYLNNFFNNLKKCNIKPILVFDGAQTYDENKSKTEEKHRRALDRFQSVLSISRSGFGDFILPATATNVFRSIAVDLNLEIVQCMYEADLEVARIANEIECPILSNDSDFMLMNLRHGVITIDLLDCEHVSRSNPSPQASERHQVQFMYMNCYLFKQENFLKYLPDLDTKNLPLIGVLAGNDFIDARIFDSICGRLSSQRFGSGRKFKRTGSKQHEKIIKIFYFLCGKTLNEAINQICLNVPKHRRANLKKIINSSLSVYIIPKEDSFSSDLYRLYWPGFRSTYGHLYSNDDEALEIEFTTTVSSLVAWLKRSMEHSVLSYRCLELANRNIIFIICHLDDPQLPSAHSVQYRPMRVMLSLLRSSTKESNHCTVYDRNGKVYAKQNVYPLTHLENYGPLSFTFFDLPDLALTTRREILLTTFHCSCALFDYHRIDYSQWLDLDHAEEFVMVKILLDYIDRENQQVRLWKHFRQATLLCVLYHLQRNESLDLTFQERMDTDTEDFMSGLIGLIKNRKYNRMPTLSKNRRYNCRLMHQITQLQSSIASFNGLNALLGDPVIRIRTENWLNSCIIYNLAEGLHERTLKLSNMPEIVFNFSERSS